MNIPSLSQIVSFIKKNNYTLTIGIILVLVIVLVIILLVFTDSNPELISAVASTGLAFATVISVITTSLVLQEERRSRKQRVKPEFKIKLEQVNRKATMFVAENIGNGPAQNVELCVEPHQDNENDVEDISYPTVPPGGSVPIGNPFHERDIISIQKTDEENELAGVDIDVDYDDILGNKMESHDEIKLESIIKRLELLRGAESIVSDYGY
jgi:Sec-independent protein translocase protein TatA